MDDEEAFRREHRQKYWGKRVAIKDSPESVRVDGVQYIMSPEGATVVGFRGHGGADFYIQFDDGRLEQSRNLWLSGDIPAEFRDQLPDNARFLARAEFLTLQAAGMGPGDPSRDLFDATVRTAFAESALNDPSLLADTPLEEARERYIEQAEAGWPAFREQVSAYPLGRTEQLRERFAEYEASFNPHLIGLEAPLRELTGQLIDCCKLDVWPGPGAVVDFGIDTDRHLGALQFAIRDEVVTPQELDAAMGNGEWLTTIAQRGGENPYRDVTFRTAWDEIREVDKQFPGYAEPADQPTRPTIAPSDPPRPTQKSKPLTM